MPADEIIVVNNGSTDKTEEVIKKYPVTLLQVTEPGIARTRAAGFQHAKSEILARIDADTQVPPDWIKKIKADFEPGKIDALTGPAIFYDAPFQPIIFSRFFVYLLRFIQGFHTLNGPNTAITKAVWEKVAPQLCMDDAKVHEDVDLAIHIARIGGRIRYDPQLIARISARRIIHNPKSFFIEYQTRLVKTLLTHGIPFRIVKNTI